MIKRKEGSGKMSVKALMCPICGGKISLEKNECKYCGANYVIETGNVIINPIDMKKIEHRENLMRDNLPDAVLRILAPYPNERIVEHFEVTGFGGGRFLVTNEKLILFKGNMIEWTVPFENFGGVSWSQKSSILAGLAGLPKLVFSINDLKNNIWRKLPDMFGVDAIRGCQILEIKINNAYELWLMKKE